MSLKQFTPATTLDDVYKTLSPEPLLSREELAAFYKEDLNLVRGGDKVARMALGLEWSAGGAFYKSFLMGHSGVGKSTEMTRLIGRISNRYRTIRFSVAKDLDPGSYKPFDVLLTMMIKLVEETAKPVDEGGAGGPPSDQSLQAILNWFSTEKTTLSQETQSAIQGAAGIGPPAASILAKAFGLFASVKGEMKYAMDRKKEVVEYRFQRLSSLIGLLNELLDDCNHRLREASGREWLFIGEDFDKPGISVKLTEELFLNYANIFRDVTTHLIFNIPIGLVYSEKAKQLPLTHDHIHCIPDTPVYKPDHSPHEDGRAALRTILEARVAPDLFEPGQMGRLIVASGGNLRDLFSLVGEAAINAILRGETHGRVNEGDAGRAINNLRTEYERSLGQSPYDVERITYDKKAERLVSIYHGHPDAKVPDPVLYSLLSSRAVQEFNGDRWFGVHPLVVDILKAQGRLTPSDGRPVAGGSE